MISLNQYEILLVTGKDGDTHAISKILKKAGYLHQIQTYEQAGIAKLNSTSFGLILLYFNNNDKFSKSALKLIKNNTHTKDLPLIFVSDTAVKSEFLIQKGRSGVAGYLTCPVDRDLLLLKIKNFLHLHHSVIQLNHAKRLNEKKASRAVISYQDLYLSLLNEVILIDNKGIVISVNRKEKLESGIKVKDILNKHYSKIPFLANILIPTGSKISSKNILELAENNFPEEFEIKLNKNNSYFGEAISSLAVINGKFHLQISIRNITDKKKDQKALSTSYREILYAEKINKSVLTGGSLTDVSDLLLQFMEEITDGKASRIYTYNKKTKKLEILLQHLETGLLNSIENKTKLKISRICPPAGKGTFFGDLIESKQPVITSDKTRIKNIIQAHTNNSFLQSISGWVAELIQIETIAIIPVISKKEVVAIISISAKRILSDEELRLILRLTELYSLVFEKSNNEQELLLSEDRYKSLFNNMNEGVIFSGEDQIIKMVNPTFCKMVGYTESELVGVNGYELLIEEGSRNQIIEKIARRVKGNSESYEMQLKTKTGNKIWVINSAFPVFDSNGSFEGIMSVITDITIRKIIEQELNQEKNKFESVLNHINDGMFQDSIDGKIIFYNKKFLEIFGLNDSDIPNIDIEYFTAPEHRDEIRERHNKRTVGEEVPELIEYQGLHKNGNRIWIEARVTAIYENGKITGTQSVIRDITRRKIRNEELKKTVTELNNRNNELMQFNYIVSHNLRAPIVSILGLGEVYKMPDLSHEERDTVTGHIQSSIKKMDELVKDLTMILATKSALNTKREWINFENLINSIKDTLAGEISETETSIIAEIPQHLAKLFTIRSYLESIIYNLICNGIKYKHPNRHPKIIITVEQSNENIIISVTDNGIGIDLARYGTQLFGLYKRFNIDVEGKGLGLHMVKTQVEALGGLITVKSEIDKGSTFTVSLPVTETNTAY